MERRRLVLEIPTRTILKVVAVAAVIGGLVRLGPYLLLFVLAVVLAIALEPAVRALVRLGFGRKLAVALLALTTLAVLIVFGALVLPPLASQADTLVSDLPNARARVEAHLPPHSAVGRRIVDEVFGFPARPDVKEQLLKPLEWGAAAASGIGVGALVLATTFYLLVDGKRAFAWMIAYVPRVHRPRVVLSIRKVSAIVYAYVRGQAITSLLFAGFVAVVLSAFGVPAVVPLAVLAAVCDVVPVVGIIIATVPAAVLALGVSPTACVTVTVLYITYHAFESYFLVPRVYGRHLRLSTLSVLLALVVGSALAGVLGAVLILPFVAAYPAIERIWLKKRLGADVIEEHRTLEQIDGVHDDAAERAVDEVILPQQEVPARRSSSPSGSTTGARNGARRRVSRHSQ